MVFYFTIILVGCLVCVLSFDIRFVGRYVVLISIVDWLFWFFGCLCLWFSCFDSFRLLVLAGGLVV